MKTRSLPSGGFAAVSRLALAAAAVCGMALATPALAGDNRDVVINIGKDGDLLEQLIELDQAGIDEMRAEIAEARAEVAEAIGEIEEAREEAKGVPGARVILNIAFAAARAGASTAVDEALGEARIEIDKAERELTVTEVSAAERAETQGAIDALREELDALEVVLSDLLDALRA